MDLTIIIYDLFLGFSILAAFFLFLVTFNTAFRGCVPLFYKFKFREIYSIAKSKPIRAGLTAISFLLFISISVSYLFPVDVTTSFLIRGIVIRLPLIAAEGIILWTIIHIEHGDWTLNTGKDDI